MASPSSSPMMAGSEILDGSSLMSLQLHLWEEIVLFCSPLDFLKNSSQRVHVHPALSLSSMQAHDSCLGFQ